LSETAHAASVQPRFTTAVANLEEAMIRDTLALAVETVRKQRGA
jgi:hypothetical protein